MRWYQLNPVRLHAKSHLWNNYASVRHSRPLFVDEDEHQSKPAGCSRRSRKRNFNISWARREFPSSEYFIEILTTNDIDLWAGVEHFEEGPNLVHSKGSVMCFLLVIIVWNWCWRGGVYGTRGLNTDIVVGQDYLCLTRRWSCNVDVITKLLKFIPSAMPNVN